MVRLAIDFSPLEFQNIKMGNYRINRLRYWYGELSATVLISVFLTGSFSTTQSLILILKNNSIKIEFNRW